MTLHEMDGTLADRGRTVLSAMAWGRLTPSEAATLMQALSAQGRIVETEDSLSASRRLRRRCRGGYLYEQIDGADHQAGAHCTDRP